MHDTARPDHALTLDELIATRFSRRALMRGSLAAAAASGLGLPAPAAAVEDAPAFDFPELAAGVDEHLHVAEGYRADVLLRWGDPLFPDAPDFDPTAQTAEAQGRQFGYNNDFVGFIPLDADGRRGLLVVNHEYTNGELMFPGLNARTRREAVAALSADQVAVEMAAHGGSVVEVALGSDGRWSPILDSAFTRRITAQTPMDLTGPAAGHPRLHTGADPGGRRVLGTVNNCSGGVTPWGTWLSGEENIHYYFLGSLPDGHPERANAERMGMGAPFFGWGRFHERFDLGREPNEQNRFGWVVEIDPHDPASIPKKRTALGRFKHEGAAGLVNRDLRYVVYLGDDERFEHVYRFVSAETVGETRAANADLLDSGTLSVARFEADGTGRWLPLVHGQGGLDEASGFSSQADVLVETRRAARLLGATPMDRPEDVEANPRTGRVYVMLTNNSKRTAEAVDPANPRAKNLFGHIVEITPEDGDHARDAFRWEVLVRCGGPESGASFSAGTSADGWFGMPDNCAIDGRGRLWIATDGNSRKSTGRADGIWAMETDGPRRGTSRHFLRVPVGAEMCGPCFAPDDETLFVAVQHPGETAEEGGLASYDMPSTRWPDFRPDLPPRPSVVAVTRKGGGRIG